MEYLVEQPPHETVSSFDITAGIKLYRYDLENHGKILPETRERVSDEDLSYIVEGVDRAARTDFVLRREGNDLVYFNQGKWTPYLNTLETGLEVAELEAAVEQKKQFKSERAKQDLVNGQIINGLVPGQKHAWFSTYPKQQAEDYGNQFILENGFNPERELGFIYMATGLEDGTVLLETQTVDNSDDEAFQAAMNIFSIDSDADIDTLTLTYDGTLMKKDGEKYYAGRKNSETDENAWRSIKKHKDLIGYLLVGLEEIAKENIDGFDLEQAVKEHKYKVWAALRERLDRDFAPSWQINKPQPTHITMSEQLMHEQSLNQEVNSAFHRFVTAGRVMPGCGGAISINSLESIMDASPESVFNSLFGKNSEKYSFSKLMYCVVCQAPPQKKESKKYCGPCGLCRTCDIKAK